MTSSVSHIPQVQVSSHESKGDVHSSSGIIRSHSCVASEKWRPREVGDLASGGLGLKPGAHVVPFREHSVRSQSHWAVWTESLRPDESTLT